MVPADMPQGGTHARGWAVSDSEDRTQEVIARLRADGARVRLRRKYETFKGERLEVCPPVHRITWEF